MAPVIAQLAKGLPINRYVSLFFGGGSDLFAMDPHGIAEFANDRDGLIMNFWQVLKDPTAFAEFKRMCEATPFSKEGFDEAQLTCDCFESFGLSPTAAWAFFVTNRQSRQGLGMSYANPTSRLRRNMNENVSAWLSAIEMLPEFHKRLQRVELLNDDFLPVLKKYVHSKTLVYCDPTYHPDTIKVDGYRYMMTEAQHVELLDELSVTPGFFILSGYDHPLYRAYEDAHHWNRMEIQQVKHSSNKKTKEVMTEILWYNFDKGPVV